FICKESKLAIKFQLDTTTGGAQLLIYDALDDCVFAETFSTIKAGKETAFTWMGKDDRGSYVSEGTYFVKVKCKDMVNDLGSFTIYAGNEFAGGNGSPSNPYKVSTIEQFKKIGGHADACFIQTTDLDFEYENFETMFTTDPFNGTYDGNNKKISNIVLNDSIFMKTSTSSCVKNMDIVNAILNVPTDKNFYTSILVKNNYGKIDSCKVNASINGGRGVSVADGYSYAVGFVSCVNHGTINNCETAGSLDMKAGWYKANSYFGSVAATNENGAKIINCKNTASLAVDYKANVTAYAGGIVGLNNGTIISTETKTVVDKKTSYSALIIGEIAGNNSGTIQSSYYNAN
ncbi:MAG: hypothetical protein K6G45_10910, partial [Lachnospiraceae bacterium]|nr:hypothetical protein [Lachnospiraceae bacterium]